MVNEVNNILPPKAIKKISKLVKFDHQRVDNYLWLKEKEDPQVIAYIQEENNYTANIMQETASLQDDLYHEILGRIKEDDESYPIYTDGYFYYSRSVKGKQYNIYCRRYKSMDNSEEIIFDLNKLAEGHQSFMFEGYEISQNNKLAAYLYNTTGSYAEYSLKIIDLTTHEEIGFTIEGVSSVAWANDNETLFYSTIDHTLKPDKVYRRKLYEKEATLVYQEKEGIFSLDVSSCKLEKYIFIQTSSKNTSEELLISADKPLDDFKVFIPRQKDVEYEVYAHDQGFYLYYKDIDNLNGKIYKLPPENYQNKALWQEIVPHDPDIYLTGFDVLKDYLLIQQKINGLNIIRVLDLQGNEIHCIDFPEEVYATSLLGNPEFNVTSFRYMYSALNRPSTLFEFDIVKKITTKLKQTEIPSGFNLEDYAVKRIWANSIDNVKVPMAVLYKKTTALDGNAPCLLYSYGSYGSSTEANFRSYVFSLVDRGYVFAIAQIRGGSELGEKWYKDGKLLNKKNTFFDFIACSEKLINDKYTSNNKLAIMGGSAGGLLVSAIANMRPDLYKTVVASVPFIDVVTTMLDEELPLTLGEYEEWGNPNIEEYYQYILSYSPYDNIKRQDYPHMLVTGGINDSQVLFHEPLKFVAKLREYKTDNNILLLNMNMDSGHGGATGKYDSIRDFAFELAFIIKTINT